eukprot:m.35151 g.35151  ORF g.35151 m.35151 type:complete len:400 (-) comp5247_c0_seq1:271-1470(-)
MPWTAGTNVPLDGGLIDGRRKSFGEHGFGWEEPPAAAPPTPTAVSPSPRTHGMDGHSSGQRWNRQPPRRGGGRIRSVSESDRGRYAVNPRNGGHYNPPTSPMSPSHTGGNNRPWTKGGLMERRPPSGGSDPHRRGGSSSKWGFHKDDARVRSASLPESESPNGLTAFVSNLSLQTTRAQLEHVFTDLQTKDIRMVHNRDTGSFRGFAYVEFETNNDLAEALKLDGVLVPTGKDERPLFVKVAHDRRGNTSMGGRHHSNGSLNGTVNRRSPPSTPKSASSGGSDADEYHEAFARDDDDSGDIFIGGTGNPALDAVIGKDQAARRFASNGGDPSSWEPSEESRALRPKLRLAKRSVSDDPGGVSDTARASIFGDAKVGDKYKQAMALNNAKLPPRTRTVTA